MRARAAVVARLLAATALAAQPVAAAGLCFDTELGFSEPLREPVALGPEGARGVYGTRADGVDWAGTRVIVPLSIEVVLAKLRDPRNIKDMERTQLVVRRLEHPDYLELRRLDVEVLVKALFVKLHVRWTEEWAWRLLEGTPERPLRALANYQKVAGTGLIRHLCGSYLLRHAAPGQTDLFLYEELDAKRRSAKDTRDMQQGILRNLLEDRFQAGSADPRVQELRVSAW